MDMGMQPYIVYVRPDTHNCVIAVNSSAFLRDANGWIEIDNGFGNKYHHAQGNYLDKPLMDERGVYRYKMDGTAVVERSIEEMDADAAQIVVSPTQAQRIAKLEAQNEMLTDCLLEMSEMVYA